MAIPVAATYGRTKDGASDARDQWWDRENDNNEQQAIVGGAANYANGQTQERDAQALENQGLSNQEASGANGHQQGAIGLAGTLARGQQPSQAAMQLQRGLQSASAQQQSLGRSARGGAALATAGANQQANTANLQQNAFTQGGMLRARDMAAGRGMLGTALAQQQEQDQNRLGQANQMGQFNADENDRYRLGMGQAAVGLGNVGNAQNQQDLAWHQGGMTSIEAQSEADQQYRQWLADAEKQRLAAEAEDS